METTDKLIEELMKLNFKDNFAVMEWMGKVQPLSNEGELISKKYKIINIFMENGFVPKIIINKSNDVDAEAKAIIQWGLHSMDTCLGLIHPMFNTFVKDWKDKFYKKN